MTGFAVGDRVTLVNVANQVGQEFEGAAGTVTHLVNYPALYLDRLIENPHFLVTLDDGKAFYVEPQHMRRLETP